uniref:DUF4408 domain-containing protein n=2 Tax=Cajanus cajan TaxID=3821 RepID=A0A151U298_CAJCA|nr:hypothetical protein KK1_006055 [Cajanus cajan]
MNKFNKSEVLVLIVLGLLLGITPLLPSSYRPTYLYFIFNVLIIALGAEAGRISAFSKPLEDKQQHVSEEKEALNVTSGSDEKKPKIAEKSACDEKTVGVTEVDKVKKCSSMPNLLFIGSGEREGEVMDEEIEAEDEIGGVINNEQELFAKAEAFIGNFYKQLKMQREESWVY